MQFIDLGAYSFIKRRSEARRIGPGKKWSHGGRGFSSDARV